MRRDSVTWSDYQKNIFKFGEEEKDSGVIIGVAGCGKTTTSIELSKKVRCWVRFMCFNKSSQLTLQNKLGMEAEAYTYNGFGNQSLPKSRLDKDKTSKIFRYEIIGSSDQKLFYKYRNLVIRSISLLKNMAVFSSEDAAIKLPDIAERYNLDLDEIVVPFILDTFKLSIKDQRRIDFDDQKFFPVLLGLERSPCEVLIVDEYQDTCLIEMLLVKGTYERAIAVGDPDQCIYSFKGTQPNAMSIFKEENNAIELPLSICYRCSKAVIQEARRIVPRIEAAPEAHQGSVDSVKVFKPEVGDFVLCRVTAELVRSCLKLLTDGVPAFVQGQDIGQNLLGVIESIEGKENTSIEIFNDKAEEYLVKKRQDKARLGRDCSDLEDKIDALLALAEGCSTVANLNKKVLSVFKEDGQGIRHLTIHKSKGLEAERVWLLRPDLLPHPKSVKPWMKEEENRLKYVAITRAQKDLFYVEPSKNTRRT